MRARPFHDRHPEIDLYAFLEVEVGASVSVIRKAYRTKAAQLHPDRYARDTRAVRTNAEHWMKILNEALEVLTDSARRAIYDEHHRQVFAPRAAERSEDGKSKRRGTHTTGGGRKSRPSGASASGRDEPNRNREEERRRGAQEHRAPPDGARPGSPGAANGSARGESASSSADRDVAEARARAAEAASRAAAAEKRALDAEAALESAQVDVALERERAKEALRHGAWIEEQLGAAERALDEAQAEITRLRRSAQRAAETPYRDRAEHRDAVHPNVYEEFRVAIDRLGTGPEGMRNFEVCSCFATGHREPRRCACGFVAASDSQAVHLLHFFGQHACRACVGHWLGMQDARVGPVVGGVVPPDLRVAWGHWVTMPPQARKWVLDSLEHLRAKAAASAGAELSRDALASAATVLRHLSRS